MTDHIEKLQKLETEARIRKVISESLSRHIDDPADKDLEADSLEVIEIAMAIEDEFRIEALADEKLENIKTVGDWFKLVTDELEQKAA